MAGSVLSRVEDPHHIIADLDSAFLFNTELRIRIQLFTSIRIRIQRFTLMRIRILLLIKGMRICDHWSTDPPGLYFEPISLPFVSARGPPPLHFEL
jgi:hypothetical protein